MIDVRSVRVGRASSSVVVVEAGACLGTEPAFIDVLSQKPARCFWQSSALRRIVLLNLEYDVESDHVHESERSGWRPHPERS